VHFEAFQCSQQAVKLYSEGWLVPGDDMKFVATNLEKDVVIVAVRRLIEDAAATCPLMAGRIAGARCAQD